MLILIKKMKLVFLLIAILGLSSVIIISARRPAGAIAAIVGHKGSSGTRNCGGQRCGGTIHHDICCRSTRVQSQGMCKKHNEKCPANYVKSHYDQGEKDYKTAALTEEEKIKYAAFVSKPSNMCGENECDKKLQRCCKNGSGVGKCVNFTVKTPECPAGFTKSTFGR